MRTFKLILRYPGIRDYIKLGDEVSQVEYNYICADGKYVIHRNEVEDWPNHWEEIKQPLFKTHDGVDVFNYNIELWYIEFRNYTSFSNNDNRHIEISSGVSNNVFSTKEAAETWIDENKPVFSKKIIRDVIDNCIKHYIRNKPGTRGVNHGLSGISIILKKN